MQSELSPSEKILDTAYQCLALGGYANVSLRDIARKAGVALSQLHYYYKSKEGLFSSVMKKMLENLSRDIREIVAGDALPAEKVRLLGEYCRAMARENSDLTRLFFDFAVQSLWIPAFKKQLHDFYDELRRGFLSLVRDFQEGGLRQPVSDHQLARFIMGALFGIVGQDIWDTDAAGGSDAFLAATLLFR